MRVREISQVLEVANRKLGGRLPVPSRRYSDPDPDTEHPGRERSYRPPRTDRVSPDRSRADRSYSDGGHLDQGQPGGPQPPDPTPDGGVPNRPVRREQGTVYGSRASQQHDGSHPGDGPDDQRPYPGSWRGR
jgi:hypothetical protein